MKNCMFVFVLLMLVSCGPNELYHQKVTIPVQGWHKDTMAVFKSEVNDLQKSVHILLEVNNSDSYAYSNAWFFIDAVSPSGHKVRDTLEYTLADIKGIWYGKEKSENDFVSTHPYKLNIKFPEKGVYKYYIAQGMRDTLLQGINSVGIRIIEVEEK